MYQPYHTLTRFLPWKTHGKSSDTSTDTLADLKARTMPQGKEVPLSQSPFRKKVQGE